MCGRYSLFAPQSELEARFDVTATRPVRPRYNCAPGQSLPVVTGEIPTELSNFTWGFVPSWANSQETSFINARAETVRTKRSFKTAFEQRRCLVPADGFYEWTLRNGSKQPYRVSYEDDRPFAMAGIWGRWTPPSTQTGLGDFGTDAARGTSTLSTFAILTTEPNDVVSPLHDRMAVILDPKDEETWLHGSPSTVVDLLRTPPSSAMRAYPVSTRVNNPRNDSPDLVDPVAN